MAWNEGNINSCVSTYLSFGQRRPTWSSWWRWQRTGFSTLVIGLNYGRSILTTRGVKKLVWPCGGYDRSIDWLPCTSPVNHTHSKRGDESHPYGIRQLRQLLRQQLHDECRWQLRSKQDEIFTSYGHTEQQMSRKGVLSRKNARRVCAQSLGYCVL